MDEGSEGRSGVTLGGVPTLWGENSGQFPHCVAHGVPPALPRERQCDCETLFFENCYRGDQGQLSTWGYLFLLCRLCQPLCAPGYPVESRRFIRGVTASFGVNFQCRGLATLMLALRDRGDG
jgi:hypothetical protein